MGLKATPEALAAVARWRTGQQGQND